MPFFTNCTKEQILSYLHSCSDKKLHELNNRIGNFIVTQLDTIELHEQHEKVLAEKIERLSNQLKNIDEDNNRMEAYNQNILENLPGNGAERYLALSALIPIHPHIQQRQLLTQIKHQHGDIQYKIAWQRFEIKTCKKELELLNAFKANKIECLTKEPAISTMAP